MAASIGTEKQRFISDITAALQALRLLDTALQGGDASAIHKSFTDVVAQLGRLRSTATAQTGTVDMSLIEHIGDPDNNNIDAWVQARVQALHQILVLQEAKTAALATIGSAIAGGAATGGGQQQGQAHDR